MVGTTATSSRRAAPKRKLAKRAKFRSADELHDVLDGLLSAVDADERSGTLLRAADLRLRLECPDLDVVVNVAASEEPGRHIEWSFSDRDAAKAKLELKMDSAVANGWLQGIESVPVAIARGEITASGDARCALLYLPAAKLFHAPYRELLRERYPHLLSD
jgi:hypothetical protein